MGAQWDPSESHWQSQLTRPVTADALSAVGTIGTLQRTGGSQQLKGS